MNVRLPDGRVLRGVPEGTTKAQIMEKMGAAKEPASPALDDEFSALEMLKNVPGSVAQLGSDLIQPVVHPLDTLTGLKRLVWGGVQKLIPGEHPDEKSVDAMVDFYASRYGGVDAALKTLESDPAGFLSDLSMGLGIAGKVGKSSKIANLANAVEPMNMAINTAGAGLKGAGKLIDPAQMYQSSAKITRTKRRPQREIDKQVQTALDEQIMPTTKGMENIQDIVGGIDNQINDAIDAATEAGGTINKDRLFRNMSKLRREFGGVDNLDATRDLATIDRVIGNYNQHLDDIGANRMTARDLQDLKQSTYRKIDFDRSQLKADLAVDETRKGIARAAKEDIESLVPGDDIKALNAREGRLLALKESLEPAASRIERRDAIGLGVPVKGAVGGAVGGPIGTGVGLLSGYLDAPKPKARMALGLHRLRNTGLMDIMTTGRMATGFRQGLMEMSQVINDEKRQQWENDYPSVFNR